MTTELDPADPDLAGLVRAGDVVTWGEGSGEPCTLVDALMTRRAEVGPFTAFFGVQFSSAVRPEHADVVSMLSMGALGGARTLAAAGVLKVIPIHVGLIPTLIRTGQLPVDVVLLQVSPADDRGFHSFGMVINYLDAAIERARVVVAEVNDQVPYTLGGPLLDGRRFDAVVRTSRHPVAPSLSVPSATEQHIADNVASCIRDGDTLQIGIGKVPAALGHSLLGHRNLGVHSGLIGDAIMDLVEAGVVTNRAKEIDTGITTTTALFGSERLARWADHNEQIALRPATYTHDPTVIARFSSFVAVNSALEVDLTGQANAESLHGYATGGVGGQGDFVRMALHSARGRSIIALPSTADGGRVSRLVFRLPDGIVTTPRSDADIIVTEFGVADLRGRALPERADALIAVSHPGFRADLRDAIAGDLKQTNG